MSAEPVSMPQLQCIRVSYLCKPLDLVRGRPPRAGAYRNVLTRFQQAQRPAPLRGGVLADDMGLGKTLTLLSLITTNRCGCDACVMASHFCAGCGLDLNGRLRNVRHVIGLLSYCHVACACSMCKHVQEVGSVMWPGF